MRVPPLLEIEIAPPAPPSPPSPLPLPLAAPAAPPEAVIAAAAEAPPERLASVTAPPAPPVAPSPPLVLLSEPLPPRAEITPVFSVWPDPLTVRLISPALPPTAPPAIVVPTPPLAVRVPVLIAPSAAVMVTLPALPGVAPFVPFVATAAPSDTSPIVRMVTLPPVVVMVPAAPVVNDAAPVAPVVAPAKFDTNRSPAPSETEPFSRTSPLACRFSLPELVLRSWTPALRVRSERALKVRLLALPQRTSLLIVIVPVPGSADVVSTITAVVASWPVSVDALMFEGDAVGSVKTPAVLTTVGLSACVSSMVMSVGSSNSVPVTPFGARVSTLPSYSSDCLPEISTMPPSPPRSPPRAVTLPWKRVRPSDQITTVPPSPWSGASARNTAAAATTVSSALRISGLAPWKSPPTRMLPPPALPDASTTLPSIEQDALPFDGDAAAALAGGQAGGVDLAGDGDDPFAAAVDDDPPFAAADRLRLDDAGHVEHGVGEGAARRRPHLDRAAVGLDPAELLQPVLRLGGAGLEEQQAVALDVDRDGVRRDHADPAAVGDDRAGVGDARPGQDHGAAGRRDRAFVAHLAALAPARRARPR